MKKKPAVFLSYSSKDKDKAGALAEALKKLEIPVWQDVRSIAAGARFAPAIEKGIRDSRAVVVLLTPESASSEWVTYEYAFATGAGVPVVAVTTRGAEVPSPIQQFQIVPFTTWGRVAKQVDAGLSEQSRSVGQKRATEPTLLAKFQECNGEVATLSKGKTPAIWMDLWLEQVPKQTTSVAFEIPDEGFRDRKWTQRRSRARTGAAREFLTDDMNSYGDVEVWASGVGRGVGNWTGSWRLYEALVRYYRSRPISAGIRAALKQIREN